MERESNPMEALCRSGCGFYGNPATDGLCSVCFKEALKKKQQPPQSTPSPVSAAPFAPATPLAAAVPTVPCLPVPVPHADKSSEDCSPGSSGASAGGSPASADTDGDNSDKDPSKDKKKKNRCAVCRKKVGLTGFECRCGGLFCSVHRYSDKHDCTFDYRELGAQEIRRNNPVVVGEKIHKI